MTDPHRQFTPTGCLMNAIRRDEEKIGEGCTTMGLRSTREVAEFCDLTVSKARSLLWRMVAAGTVDVYDGKGVSNGEGNLWCLKRLPIPGEKLKVTRSIGARNEEVEATLLAFIKSSVLPVQVSFTDGERTGYLHQEIREIVG